MLDNDRQELIATSSARVREGGSMLPNIPIATDNIY